MLVINVFKQLSTFCSCYGCRSYLNIFFIQAKQAEVLGYRSTWFSLWLWTINSADAFMNYTLFAIFFGKLWVCMIIHTYILPLFLSITILTRLRW